jgi:hypothetical protein
VHELAEVVTVGDQEYEEIVEEYEEEVPFPQEFPEPSATDRVEFAPDQGKPRCITLIFDKYAIYICCALSCRNYMIPTCIYIYYPMSLTSAGSNSCHA